MRVQNLRTTFVFGWLFVSACSGFPSNNLSGAADLILGVNLQRNGSSNASLPTKILYRTQFAYMGASIGGVSAADSSCNTDPAKPNGTYKAVLVDTTTRVACTTANCSSGSGEHIGWVLYSNYQYMRSDGVTPIFTTNQAGINVGPAATNSIDGTTNNYWTGLQANWTTDPTNRCNGWMTGAGAGSYGVANSTNSSMLAVGTNSCNAPTASILCAQQ